MIQPPLCIIFSPGGSFGLPGLFVSFGPPITKKAAAVPEFSGAAAAIFLFWGLVYSMWARSSSGLWGLSRPGAMSNTVRQPLSPFWARR